MLSALKFSEIRTRSEKEDGKAQRQSKNKSARSREGRMGRGGWGRH